MNKLKLTPTGGLQKSDNERLAQEHEARCEKISAAYHAKHDCKTMGCLFR